MLVHMKPSQNVFLDFLFKNVTRAFACFVFLLLLAIIVALLYESRESLSAFGLSFLWTNEWDPVNHQYGALVPMVGTVLTSLIALLIAVPASFGIAMFLTELAPVWLRRPLGIAIEMLAAIPSIIYGMWGLFVFVHHFQRFVQPYLIDWFAGIPVLDPVFAGRSEERRVGK